MINICILHGKRLIFSPRTANGLKGHRAPSPGQANACERHPGYPSPRTLRPERAKALNHVAHHIAFALSGRHPVCHSTQGAVPFGHLPWAWCYCPVGASLRNVILRQLNHYRWGVHADWHSPTIEPLPLGRDLRISIHLQLHLYHWGIPADWHSMLIVFAALITKYVSLVVLDSV